MCVYVPVLAQPLILEVHQSHGVSVDTTGRKVRGEDEVGGLIKVQGTHEMS